MYEKVMHSIYNFRSQSSRAVPMHILINHKERTALLHSCYKRFNGCMIQGNKFHGLDLIIRDSEEPFEVRGVS